MAWRMTILTLVMACAIWTAPSAQQGNQGVDAYRVIGNIYYVGSTDISSHVISTPAGLILLDTGTSAMVPVIRANVEKLGFRLQDIKILLSSHAHFDHVEGHAEMQALTGAEIMAVGEDATAIASGVDNSALGAQGWKPVKVNRILKHGDSVSLGGVTMQAHLTPGHTKGCTTWTTTVQDGGRAYLVVFVGGISINEGVKLLKNKLSEYVRLAAAGETILVTDRDQVVAELGPPTPGRAETLADARLAEAVRNGWIRPPTAPGPLSPRQPVMTLAELLAGLADDRQDRT